MNMVSVTIDLLIFSGKFLVLNC